MIGDRIKEERTKRNMTQSDLGKVLDVSSSTIGMYEQNRRQPDISTLIKIADYFNISTDFLLNRTGKDNEITTIAAHNDNDEFTDEDLKDIEKFKEYVRVRNSK